MDSHTYYNKVFPHSVKQPTLIMFHSDWCFMCMRVEPIWARLVEELEPVGFNMATVHADHERELTRKVGTRELPHMVLIMDKKIVHYKDPQFSAIRAIEFVRSRFPYRLVELIDDSNVDEFLDGWMDNRIRVLIFGHVEITRLRYLTTAFKYRHRAAVGYVKISDGKARRTIQRFSVPTFAQTDTLLLFHEKHPEDPAHVPVASVSMKDLGINTMSEVIDANLFLQLPRLSSQSVFDALCPVESSRQQKRLCVTLVTQEVGEDHEKYRQALRDFAQEHVLSPDRVRFTYVLMEKQEEFLKSLSAGQKKEAVSDPVLKIAILWRRGNNKLKFEWFKGEIINSSVSVTSL
jgi:DnaJ family protein C protein 16